MNTWYKQSQSFESDNKPVIWHCLLCGSCPDNGPIGFSSKKYSEMRSHQIETHGTDYGFGWNQGVASEDQGFFGLNTKRIGKEHSHEWCEVKKPGKKYRERTAIICVKRAPISEFTA